MVENKSNKWSNCDCHQRPFKIVYIVEVVVKATRKNQACQQNSNVYIAHTIFSWRNGMFPHPSKTRNTATDFLAYSEIRYIGPGTLKVAVNHLRLHHRHCVHYQERLCSCLHESTLARYFIDWGHHWQVYYWLSLARCLIFVPLWFALGWSNVEKKTSSINCSSTYPLNITDYYILTSTIALARVYHDNHGTWKEENRYRTL